MTREFRYWAALAVVAVGLACVFLFWTWPTRARMNLLNDNLARRIEGLNRLGRAVGDIRPEQTLEEYRKYRDWLDDELNKKVLPFFAARDAVLDAPLVVSESGEEDGPPGFKAAYLSRRRGIHDELTRRCPGMKLPRNLFSQRFGWADGSSLPNPNDYKTITQDINIRRALLLLAANCQASEVLKLDVQARKPSTLQEPCDRIPVLFSVIVPADKASEFIRSIQQASSTSGPQSLCMCVNKLELEKLEAAGQSPAETYVGVTMELDVLDFPDSLREEKRPEAPKP